MAAGKNTRHPAQLAGQLVEAEDQHGDVNVVSPRRVPNAQRLKNDMLLSSPVRNAVIMRWRHVETTTMSSLPLGICVDLMMVANMNVMSAGDGDEV